MNFTFSDPEKILFQQMASALDKSRNHLEKCACQTEKDIAQALHSYNQCLEPLGYLKHYADPKSIGPVARLEMMRIFARHQPSLFLGHESAFRIFPEIFQHMPDASAFDQNDIGAIAFCEDFVETDPKSMQISIQKKDTHFIVSGKKSFVMNAQIASWIAVNGKIDNKTAILFVSSQSPGIDIVPLQNKHIFSELAMANITFTHCSVPINHVIFEASILAQVQLNEDMAYIACALGMIDQCIQTATAFTKKHESEKKPLIAHQAVAFSLAEMVTLKQTAELLAYRAAWMLATDNSEKIVLVNCAKVFCSEAAETIASKSMKILGGQVFENNHVVEQAFHNSKFLQLAGTSTHLARIAIADVSL